MSAAAPTHATHQPDGVLDVDLLSAIERKVLWLSTAIIDAANGPARKDPDGLKIGGHQASSASMATIMTALWFTELTSEDRVSVKPHASPGAARDQLPAR